MTEHPSPNPCRVGIQRRHRFATPLAGVVLVAGLAACTSESTPAEVAEQPGPSAETAAPFELSTRVTRVAGRLPQRRQEKLAVQVGKVVSAYLEGAFLDPVTGSPFAGFTPGARVKARRERAVLTRSGLGGADAVTAPEAATYLAVLAPKGNVVGVTARLEVDLRVQRGEQEQVVPLRGRLMLTPTGSGWRIFGYDVQRAAAKTVEGEVS